MTAGLIGSASHVPRWSDHANEATQQQPPHASAKPQQEFGMSLFCYGLPCCEQHPFVNRASYQAVVFVDALWLCAGSDDPENPDELQTRALKRPRLVWTAQLHQRFVDAVKQLGLKNAVPKTIMQV